MAQTRRKGIATCGRALSVLFAALFLSLPTSSAAQQITFTSASASWRNAQDNVPGSQPGDPVITNGVPTSSISWGGSSPQSGYDVTITIPDPQQFPVAEFAHRNFTVPDPALTSVELDFVLDFEIDGAPIGPLTFTFTFTHEETPNNLDPCPYPTPPGEGCTDRVTFLDAPDLTTFTVGGKTYTLGLNFLDVNGDPVDEFITREGGVVNTADLDVEFELVPPVLEVTKSGPATMAIGQWGDFTIDVQNTGPNVAWNATLRDALPEGGTGGMCDMAPQVLAARVFEADGSTPVAGKGPLSEGVDFALSFAGAPTCELTLTMLTPEAAIGPDERLVVSYRTQLDPDTQDGVDLTNVAGATEWFDDATSNPGRGTYTRTLSDGSVGVVDHEDAHTLTTVVTDFFFEKTVANLDDGIDPATAAAPGDTLRYTLRLQATDRPLSGLTFADDLGDLNPGLVFEPGSLSLVSVPVGADSSNTDPNGGANGEGVLDIRNLDVPAASSIEVQFDITLAGSVIDGTVVTNQADLLIGATRIADSDDPNLNGQADPSVPGDEDPTRVVIEAIQPVALAKENTQATASVGEAFSYRITVPSAPHDSPLFDVRILDDLSASAADLRFLEVTKISGSGSWTPVNTGSATSLVIEDPANGIDIPAGEQAVVEITVVLEDSVTNVSGLSFTNTASYLYNLLDEDDATQRPGDPGTTPPMTIVGPDQLTLEKRGPLAMTVGTPGVFTLEIHNPSTGPAWNATVLDRLADAPTGGTCDAGPSGITAQLFEADGMTPASPALVQGTDFSATFSPAPTCELELTMLSPAATLPAGQRLLVGYSLDLDADTQDGASLTNVAGVTEWFSADGSNPLTIGDRRTFARTVTDGTPGVLDHEDAHTLTVTFAEFVFEKTVANVTTAQDPAAVATPGDRLRYRLRIENTNDTPIPNFQLLDELDALNATAAFVPGTLTIVAAPAGADIGNTDPAGGANGTGVLDVRGLTLPGAGVSVVVEFEVTLASVIANGTSVTNQSQLLIGSLPLAQSDDPNINGPADPTVPGDEDPTRILIQSAPAFRVEKTSAYLGADPDVLLAGESLRYTITVKNVGTDNASDTVLRDSIPFNTTYVAGSTTLNGNPVPDGPADASPVPDGIPLNAPENPTPGAMRADVSAGADNVATVVFEVVVAPDVADGTIISNQAFVSALAGGVVDQPSDDPRTSVPDDPTRDVVGRLPVLFASKDAEIATDGGSPGVVDPGDVLRYTIRIFNNGTVPATNVVLSDNVPANTAYVANTVTLDGLPVGQPDGGAFPLAAGIAVSSSDLTPPIPGPGMGTLNPGESAEVTFELLVDAGVAAGTLISNQAIVASDELPDLPTDGDGNPSTGPEPTIVVVGDTQQLAITKQVVVVGGGAALPGSVVEYTVRVTNVASVPVADVLITDDLDDPVANQLALVPGSATLDGATAGIAVAGSVVSADYSTPYGPLDPGASAVLRFRATIDPGLPTGTGTTVTNTGVVTWNAASQMASASVSFDVGGMLGVAAVSGTVWHDADFDLTVGGGERLLEGWTVELLQGGSVLQSTSTVADGTYQIVGLAPNDVSGDAYALRFRAPGARARTASLGTANSPFTNGPQQIDDVVVGSGSNLSGLDLPITPNGVVYGAIGRDPAPRVRVTLSNAATGSPLSSLCFDDPSQQGQSTAADGYYKFDLNFSGPDCPSGGRYLIGVDPRSGGLVGGESELLPAATNTDTAPFSVASCPAGVDDAVPGTAQHCEVQPSLQAPAPSAGAGTEATRYYLHVTLDDSFAPGSSQLFNNHIPVDPELDDAVSITKTTPSVDVSRGDLVPYEIIVRNGLGTDIVDLQIVDRFPAGFNYVKRSAHIDGERVDPDVQGRSLVWSGLDLASGEQQTLLLLLAVGAGVSEGKFVNRAQALDGSSGSALSGEATATVRVVPDPDFACTDVLGKVFDDIDQDGEQDRGELGLPGVKLVTARGLVATTDAHGRFHITCAVVPREGRGSNFVLKLDDGSLPSGYRMSTRQVQVKRATRGKALRFRFGASIHRVVGLDLADAVFEPGALEMREHWRPRLELLFEALEKGPSVLRLSYVADLEDEELVERRVAATRQLILDAWEERGGRDLTVETEIFWRRGGPPDAADTRTPASPGVASLPSVDAGPPLLETESRATTERHLPAEPEMHWTHDPDALENEDGDRLEEQQVVLDAAETVKLRDVVPPIRFASGVADIPPGTVARLRGVLAEMSHLDNVRLHLVGHSDDQPLSDALARVYGDNAGLSRERAGEVAEFLQAALALPPEAVSYEWAGDSQPVAPNTSEQGRGQNRRVEVEVWYDEIGQKVGVEEVVVPADFRRVKVCRVETVCKLRYREGHERRARVRNLVAPLRFEDETVGIPQPFVRQIRQALENLSDEHNVTVKFVGHTDDAPLTGRAERIYGTHLSLSKARARRVALAIQEELGLPTSAVASDGRGSAHAVASNATGRGRALNRRVEVEFWHDDPLQELPDEPQPCPDAADAELVTQVYEPPWGRLEPLGVENGEVSLPAGLTVSLRRALDDVADRVRPRLRFIGYTQNQTLDRRTALVYGDDIGLSASRARRAMERVREAMGLDEAQAEHEGRGFVHSDDVVNGGFLQGDTSHVVVQVVYDEPALAEDYDGVDVLPLTRELKPSNPLKLNLMRITLDGEPLDDPGRSSADVQRCTDVALDAADLRFHFDSLESTPRLSVASQPLGAGSPSGTDTAPGVRFRTYTNYAHFIERAEVRIFHRDDSLQSEPLAILAVGEDGTAEWLPEEFPETPLQELDYVLRAYGTDGGFDETARQELWLAPNASDLAAYGEAEPVARGIPLEGTGSVRVEGRDVPAKHRVWVAGEPVPVDENGRFVAEAVLPLGTHTVEVAVLDDQGNGELFLRDLELERSDWFYVGIADLTFSETWSSGAYDELRGADEPDDPDSFADGRLAFFLTGKFAEDWKLTASADTREEPVEDLFSNFLDKKPESLFRRVDPDYHYPTYGDDGTVEQMAPTSGKFFAKLSHDQSHALWGNFKVEYNENELALVERGLYGGNLHLQSNGTTRFGEPRVALDGFAADPGTIPSREEFRGTGGSLYFLRRQDVLNGSEQVRVELRDKDTGLVIGAVPLNAGLDYDIDYFQGRILLSEPLQTIANDHLLVRSDGLSGNEVWLVVNYEFSPGFDEPDTLAAGGQGHMWLTDFLKLGLTANHNDDVQESDGSLYAADLTLRMSSDSWIKLQGSRSEGLVSSASASGDGGFTSVSDQELGFEFGDAYGYRGDASVGLADFLDGLRGRLTVYAQRLDAGYSAPGLATPTDTNQYGGTLSVPLLERLDVAAKWDRTEQEDRLKTATAELDLGVQLTEQWSVRAGARLDDRDDDSPVEPVTQDEGHRTDAVVQVRYDSGASWSTYGFAQGTVSKSGDRETNHRAGVGGAYRVTEKLGVDGEVSEGNLGLAAKAGTSYQKSERTSLYLNYALDNEREYSGLHRRNGNLVTGARSRFSDSGSVYIENRYQHANVEGLSHAVGASFSPAEGWTLGASWESGTTHNRQTNAETDRRAGGGRVGYGTDRFDVSTGVEYVYDRTQQPDGSRSDRTTWLLKNGLKLELTPDWRMLAKLNHAFSDSSLGDFFDGGFTEAVAGYAYRPVAHDRLNALAKYTYFYNLPPTDQVNTLGTSSIFVQRSHVAALDVTYDLTSWLSIGGKYAYRRGEVSLERKDPDFFDNDAHLYILRADWRFYDKWETTAEGRMLHLPDLDQRRSGALVAVSRYLTDNFKVGVGYNFTDFSDDLTDLDYDHQGFFLNIVGAF